MRVYDPIAVARNRSSFEFVPELAPLNGMARDRSR